MSSMKSGASCEAAGRADDSAPLRLLHEAGAHVARVDASLRADQALHQLLLGHLQAEEQDRPLELDGTVGGDVERECRLARRRPPRDDHEVRPLKPRGQLVQIREPRGQPGDVLLAVVQHLDVLDGVVEDLADGERASLEPPLGDAEQHLLGAVEERLHVVRLLVALLDDLAGDADQLPEERLLAHDAGVRRELGGDRAFLLEHRQEGVAPDLLEDALAPERLRHRDGVGRLAALEQTDHRPEDLPVGFLVELLRDEELDGPREQGRLQQDRAQHCPLGLEALRRDLAGELDRSGHGARARGRATRPRPRPSVPPSRRRGGGPAPCTRRLP